MKWMFIFVLGVSMVCCDYINDWDKELKFECPSGVQSIHAVHSIHNNHHEDRRFDMSCANVVIDTGGLHTACFWTPNYVNDYDQPLHYTCPTNHYISGMESIHNNHKEDRIWKFKCCSATGLHLVDCNMSGWTNAYDMEQNYHVPTGEVMKGVFSVHSNSHEDRLYEYETCNVERSDGEIVG